MNLLIHILLWGVVLPVVLVVGRVFWLRAKDNENTVLAKRIREELQPELNALRDEVRAIREKVAKMSSTSQVK